MTIENPRPPNGAGMDMWLPVAGIVVDPRYQRQPSTLTIDRIAADYRVELAGAIEVSHREDGHYVVLDGQQRVLGARKAGVQYIRAIVHTGMSLEDEARRFVELNTLRTKPKTLAIFHAKITAGDAVARQIVDIVESEGMTVARHEGSHATKNAAVITATGSLETIYGAGGGSLLRDTLRVCKTAWPDDYRGMTARLLRGVASVIFAYSGHPNFSRSDMVERLAKTPALVIEQRGSVLGAETGGSGAGLCASYAGWRMAVAEAYNRGRTERRKIPVLTPSQITRLGRGQSIWDNEQS